MGFNLIHATRVHQSHIPHRCIIAVHLTEYGGVWGACEQESECQCYQRRIWGAGLTRYVRETVWFIWKYGTRVVRHVLVAVIRE